MSFVAQTAHTHVPAASMLAASKRVPKAVSVTRVISGVEASVSLWKDVAASMMDSTLG